MLGFARLRTQLLDRRVTRPAFRAWAAQWVMRQWSRAARVTRMCSSRFMA